MAEPQIRTNLQQTVVCCLLSTHFQLPSPFEKLSRVLKYSNIFILISIYWAPITCKHCVRCSYTQYIHLTLDFKISSIFQTVMLIFLVVLSLFILCLPYANPCFKHFTQCYHLTFTNALGGRYYCPYFIKKQAMSNYLLSPFRL